MEQTALAQHCICAMLGCYLAQLCPTPNFGTPYAPGNVEATSNGALRIILNSPFLDQSAVPGFSADCALGTAKFPNIMA